MISLPTPPGLGPAAGIAIVLPITYSLDPTASVIMMAGIFYGAMYGGSTTAVLVNMPGESASVMTCIDGYKLTRKGWAGAVLSIVGVGSFIGGTISVFGVMLFSPALGQFGMMFGPAEFLNSGLMQRTAGKSQYSRSCSTMARIANSAFRVMTTHRRVR